MPGPIPRTEDELARKRERKGKDFVPVTVGERRKVTKIPNASPDWPEPVKRLYKSAKTSGQADFYQDSDWAYFYVVCDQLASHYKRPSAVLFAAVDKALGSLLLNEGERRRVRVELRNPPPEAEDAAVKAMEKYRDRLGAK